MIDNRHPLYLLALAQLSVPAAALAAAEPKQPEPKPKITNAPPRPDGSVPTAA